MAKILVTTLPHEGHLNPTFGIAAELQKRGHEIKYLGHPVIDDLISRQGFTIIKNRRMGLADLGILIQIALLRRSRGEDEMRHAIKLFTMRLVPQVKHINKLIKNYAPDIILNDAFHYAGSLASEMSGIPWVDCWTAGMLHPDAMPYLCPVDKSSAYNILELFDRRYNRSRNKLGLEEKPAGEFLRPSPWLQLYTSCKEIEPELPETYPTAVSIGPCIGERYEEQIDLKQLWDKKYTDYPLIYVSFGTFFNRKKRYINYLIKVAEKQKIRLLVSTPFTGVKIKSRNVVLLKRVPQQQVLREANLFITHGGNNSVQESLLAGVPMLVMPVAGEQMYNAHRVQWLGVGDIIDIDNNAINELRQKIFSFLNSEKVSKLTEKYMRILGEYKASETAANLIESILTTGKPVCCCNSAKK